MIRPFDLLYYEDLGEWKPIRDVFEIHEGISNFVDEGQDKVIVGEVFRGIQQLFGENEQVYYIAVQEKGALSLGALDAVALTETRIFVAHHKQGKLELEAYLLGQRGWCPAHPQAQQPPGHVPNRSPLRHIIDGRPNSPAAAGETRADRQRSLCRSLSDLTRRRMAPSPGFRPGFAGAK